MMAPIAPFISDEIYTKLTGETTVHTAYYPEADESLIDDRTEERMDLVKVLVNLGRSTREQEKLKVRQPLSKVIVDGSYRDVISDLTDLIKEELNVHEVQFEDELDKYMDFSIKPNFRAAGPVLGKNVKAFGAELAKADAKAMIASLNEGPVKMELGGEEYEITKDLVDVRISSKEPMHGACPRSRSRTTAMYRPSLTPITSATHSCRRRTKSAKSRAFRPWIRRNSSRSFTAWSAIWSTI
jgi:isoleucyl-tRNA synthetase